MISRRFLIGLSMAASVIPGLTVFAAPPSPAAPVLCVVKGEEIKDISKAAGKVDYNGKTYFFCCAGCKATFAKSGDAEKSRFAHVTDLRTEKIVLQKQLETVNAELTTLESKKPAPGASTVVAAPKTVYCAVTGEEIGAPDQAFEKTAYSGKTYYFCCAGCKPKFEANPAKYAAAADQKAVAAAK